MDVLRQYVAQILELSQDSPLFEPRADQPVRPAADAPKIVSFYLPQFHRIPENDEWWGEGFTEWANVTRSMPQFVGHEQPRLPGPLGFYDLSNIDTIRRQVDLARHYGVHGFCFYYYYFSGRRILEKPLELLLGAPDIDFPFAICWANENWTRGWNSVHDILLAQDHEHERVEDFALTVAPILRDPRYIRVDGKPLLLVYNPATIPDFPARLDVWREVFAREGVGEVVVYMVQAFGQYDPRVFACDGAIEFPPHNIGFHGNEPISHTLPVINPEFLGWVVMAETVLERARHSLSLDADYRWIRGCNPSWDNNARRPGRGWTMHESTPDFFERWLRYLAGEGNPGPVRNPENYLFVNAWNEWAEAAYLEPDRKYGYAYLNRVARVLQG